jgi:hypothetical protein
MKLIPRYLVNNKIEIVANEAGFATEYKPVYQRHISVYRGIDNTLQFKLLNADQKPINTSLYTPRFVAFDENDNMVIDRDCIVLDDGSSTTKGLFQTTITENDLLSIKQQYFSYAVYLVDSTNTKKLTYVNSHHGNNGVIYISGQVFPGAKEPYQINTFTQEGEVWYSETITAEPALNGNEALHTAAIYTDEYIGDVTIEATLENQITGTTSWAPVTTVSINSATAPIAVNFNGVFNFLRFKSSTNPSNAITKILVRN